MKKLITYLKTLWSWGANSQSSDVSHDCRFTVGSPSGMTAKLQVNTFMRFAVVLTLIFTLGVGNVWGEEITYTFSSKSWTASPADWKSNTAGSSFESSGSARGVANNGVNGACTSPITFANVSSISIVASSNATGGKVAIKIGDTQIANKSIDNENNITYTYDSDDYPSIANLSGNVQIVVTKNSKTVWVKSITITYSAAPAYTVGWTIDPAAGGSLSTTSGTSTTVTPNSAYTYGSPSYTVTTGSATVSQNTNTFTATPTSDCTIRINMVEKPKYTVTLKDDGDTRTQASAGASVTLPVRAGCAGYTFAGWTKTWVADQTEWTTTAPTIIPAGNYTPTANENLYPVYTKEEGGGEPVETKTQTFQYDTWEYGGSSTNKSSYRLFHEGGYVESASDVDFSKLSKVIVSGGTFGGSSYNRISIKKADGALWKDATVSGSKETGTNTITGGASLTGSAKLRVYSTCGSSSSNGVRISKVEVYTMEGGSTTSYISVPSCGPQITITGQTWVTSTHGQNVKAILDVEASNFGGDYTMTATSSNANFTATLASSAITSGSASTQLVVVYNPSATTDGTETTTLTITANNGASTSQTFTLNGRHLPEQFVMVTDNDSKWWAVPANMSGSNAYAGVEVAVDNSTTPTKVTAGPASALYALTAVHTSNYDTYGTAVRFYATETNKMLWGTSSDNTGINNNAVYTGTSTDHGYEWTLTTMDGVVYALNNVAYDIKDGNTPGHRALRYYNSEGKYGMYTSGNQSFRFLPVDCATRATISNIEVTHNTATLTWSGASSSTYTLIIRQGSTPFVTHNSVTSPTTVSGLSSSTTYTYILTPGTESDGCALQGTFTTSVAPINVVLSCDGTPYDMGSQTAPYTLPTTGAYVDDACAEWTFLGWSANQVNAGDSYTLITQATTSGTYYAVYSSAGIASTSSNCCTEVTSPTVSVVARSTSATLSWDNQAGATNGYTVVCSDGTNTNLAAGVTSLVIENLTENTTYTYTVTAKGATCNRSTNGEFTTLETTISIAEWDTAAVYLDLGNVSGATAVIENQNTQADIKQNFADNIFFSKYFEASGFTKLVGLFNGTDHAIDISDLVIKGSDNSGWVSSGNNYVIVGNINKLSTDFGDGAGQIMLPPSTEIILYSIQEGDKASYTASGCLTDYSWTDLDLNKVKHWYRIGQTNSKGSQADTDGHSPLNFSGKNSIGLWSGSSLIDIIGAGNSSKPIQATTQNTAQHTLGNGRVINKPNDDAGFFCEDGMSPASDEYPDGYTTYLTTNRCLLIRSNKVKSGENAVNSNTSTFATLCTEWTGIPVGNDGTYEERSCLSGSNFGYVGKYDYNDYYAQYDTIMKNYDLSDKRQPDGTYKIAIPQLDAMSCTNLRIVVTTSGGEKMSGTWKVPIFVTNDGGTNSDGNVKTDDEVFTKEGEDCATCDVVVLRKANLQVVDGGKNTIRNIEVYPTATLDVPTGKTYNINSIIMRSKDDTVSRANVIGTLTPTIKNVYLDKRITATRVYKFSLPYACNIADVTWRSGEKAVYGTDWILRWYDGDRRANGTQNGNWKLFTGSIIQPGVGYDLVINSDVLEPKNKYAELRFPMAIGGDNVTSPAEVSVPVKAYGANNSRTKDGQPVTPNHLGWNLIGNPYLNDYTKNHMPNDLTEGALSIVDDKYVLTPNGLRYLVVPTYAGSTTYQQVNMAITDMEPFTAYFVQIDGTTDNQELNVVFSLSNVAGRSAVRSRLPVQEYEEDNHIVWYAIDMSNNGGKKDETTLLISNRFNDKFEMMDDMHKIRNAGQSIIATRNDDGEMVFNALPDSSAAVKGVPVHYYAAEAGDYTISTSANYSLEEVAEAWLFDKSTGQYTNLLTDNYRFATAAGNNTDRFTLFVRVERKKAPEVATGNDNILTDGQLSLTAIDRTLVLSGMTENADVYVYDMSGKLLRGERANGNGIWRANVPAQGVYFVRVNSAGGQQTLRTIVK